MRDITTEESLEILRPLIEKEAFISWHGHGPYPHRGLGEGVYKFIINIMSLDLLISIMEDPQVYNVYFTAAAPGPGKGLTGISMNYRVYVKYHKVQD